MSMRLGRSAAAYRARRVTRFGLQPTVLAWGIALVLSGPVHAQDTTDTTQATSQDGAQQKTAQEKKQATELGAVSVTGIRASVERAQDIKRYADTFVDSVTALDIGALPDRSITETLSRIPGVTIDHFLSVGDPEHFSAEGNGVQVRGLTQVRSELNGRDSFSASGGRNLSFQDVPSELMGGVDVYKNQTAEMIEGGLGGTVNLRTRMPFDFEGQKVSFSLSENYGDFVKKYKPSASALYSNRWKTDAGEFGILVDVAHSELATRTDGLFVRPFFKNANTDVDGDGTGDELWLPRGADWRALQYERKRDGAYVAFQWKPNDDMDLAATVFQSRYDELWNEDAIFVSNDPTQVALDTSHPYDLDGNVFKSGYLTQPGGVPMGTDIRASHRKSKTTDYAINFKWRIADNTEFSTDLQYIKADTRALDSTIALGVNVPYIDVGLGGVPSIGVDQDFTTNPANYYWGFTMEDVVKNRADEFAWRADIKQSFDSTFFRSIKAGVRTTTRKATNIDTGYNWQPVFQTWMAWWAVPTDQMPSLDLNDKVNSSLVHLDKFRNFYRGGAGVPGAFYAPVLATALGYPGSYHAIHDAASPYYVPGSGYENGFAEREPGGEYTNDQHENTRTGYAMLNFGVDDWRFDGNVGVRVVRTENEAKGFLIYPNVAYAPYLGSGQSEPINAENAYTDVLPSLNASWEMANNLILRVAASKAVARPNFGDMQAYQMLTAGTKQGVTAPTDGSSLPVSQLDLSGSSYDNPYLKPMRATQYDLSLEWYFDPDHGGMAWANFFYKDVKDYFRREARQVAFPGADGNSYDYLITRPVNVGKAKIQGVELGWNQFFDFLPGAFSGLGMSANYTYIDSTTKVPNSSDTVPRDTDGSLFGTLPADGLSKNSFNVAAFYEKGPWQIRLAYNWRSKYLLSVGPNGYNGGDGGIDWKLPVYSDDFGQLDGSIFYKFTDHLQLGLEVNNLNNAEQRTIMDQNGAGSRVTSWYVNDRRYAATLRMTF